MKNILYSCQLVLAKFYLAAILFFLSSTLFAQHATLPDTELGLQKMKARAHHAERIGDTYTSLFYYEKIVAKDTSDLEAQNHLGTMYEATRNYQRAEEVFGKLYLKDAVQYPFALYHRGLMEKQNGKYEAALKSFELFKTKHRNLGDKIFKSNFNRELAGCDSGLVYRDYPENTVVQNSGNSVNHPHAEFSPIHLDSNTMLYGSLRMDTLKFFDIRPETAEAQPSRQLYKAVKQNGQWQEQGKFHLINDSSSNMGNVAYSSTSNKFYFSKCDKDQKGKVTCKIYVTENKDGIWSKAEALPSPVNLPGTTSTQPTIVSDTATASILPSKAKPSVRKPVRPNGKVLLKPTPKLAIAQKLEYLYFVSDRPGGKGGLDIWYTSYNAKKKAWNPPVNFTPANTAGAEYTPYYHGPTQNFYFSSDGHVSAGGLDIYKLSKSGTKFANITNLSFPINSPQDDLGFMLGEDTAKGFLVSNRPGGTPYFHETCCDDIYSVELLPPSPYKNVLALTLIDSTATCGDHMLTVVSYDLNQKEESHDTMTIKGCRYTMPLKQNHNYSFLAERAGFRQSQLFVEIKGRNMTDTLRKLMVLKPIPIVAVEQVVEKEKFPDPDLLVSNIITPEPIVLPKKETANKLKPIESIPKPVAMETEKAIEKEEQKKTDETKEIKVKPTTPDMALVTKREKVEERPTENIPFVLKEIQYATDQAGLSKNAKLSLDSILIPYLKLHPENKVIIGSHTDNQASYTYNMLLSKRRADNVVKYLISKGISRTRLQSKGYGESKPMAPNTLKDGRDNPEGRQLNRRTEFFVTGSARE